jgi:hypothetical protein
VHLQDQMPLDHALHPTWLAAPSAQPQFTRPPGWSRDSCRWPWRRTAAGNAYCLAITDTCDLNSRVMPNVSTSFSIRPVDTPSR